MLCLRNHLAQYQLLVHMSGNSIPFDPTPRYLGVSLDRSLIFRQHIDKMTFRVAFVKQMAGLNREAYFDVIRKYSLPLVVVPAENFSPV